MTTKAAAASYLAQHQHQMENKGSAIHNPHNKPIRELPVIYGFNNGGSPGMLHAQLLSEDGVGLGGHLCSDEGYMQHDLGILEGTRPDRHQTFQEYYPDGYRMEWVPTSEVKKHVKFTAALALAKKKYAEAKELESKKVMVLATQTCTRTELTDCGICPRMGDDCDGKVLEDSEESEGGDA